MSCHIFNCKLIFVFHKKVYTLWHWSHIALRKNFYGKTMKVFREKAIINFSGQWRFILIASGKMMHVAQCVVYSDLLCLNTVCVLENLYQVNKSIAYSTSSPFNFSFLNFETLVWAEPTNFTNFNSLTSKAGKLAVKMLLKHFLE